MALEMRDPGRVPARAGEGAPGTYSYRRPTTPQRARVWSSPRVSGTESASTLRHAVGPLARAAVGGIPF
jgi:hypothetical protein